MSREREGKEWREGGDRGVKRERGKSKMKKGNEGRKEGKKEGKEKIEGPWRGSEEEDEGVNE